MSSYLKQKRNDSEVGLIDHRRWEDENDLEHEKMKHAFDKKNAYESASCWSKLFFSWTSPLLKYSKKNQLSIDELGTVRKSHDVKVQHARLVKAWDYYKHGKSKYGMFKAILRAYRFEYTVAVLWSLVVASLQLISPFLLRWTIEFIGNQEEDT